MGLDLTTLIRREIWLTTIQNGKVIDFFSLILSSHSYSRKSFEKNMYYYVRNTFKACPLKDHNGLVSHAQARGSQNVPHCYLCPYKWMCNVKSCSLRIHNGNQRMWKMGMLYADNVLLGAVADP